MGEVWGGGGVGCCSHRSCCGHDTSSTDCILWLQAFGQRSFIQCYIFLYHSPAETLPWKEVKIKKDIINRHHKEKCFKLTIEEEQGVSIPCGWQ